MYNYTLISYIYHNINKYEEKVAYVMAKQYVNIVFLRCKYTKHDEILKNCPNLEKNVPQWF